MGGELASITPGPEFARLFRSFEYTAFRLETRDQYNSPRETESFRKFLAGEPDVSYHENWLTMVREATSAGRLFSRVRVVGLPLGDYARFAMWVAGFTREAGDDIRYLPRDQAEAAELPQRDFWLFDSSKLVLMNFGEDDRFIGAEVIEDPAVVVRHNYWRDAACHLATTPNRFVAKYEDRMRRS